MRSSRWPSADALHRVSLIGVGLCALVVPATPVAFAFGQTTVGVVTAAVAAVAGAAGGVAGKIKIATIPASVPRTLLWVDDIPDQTAAVVAELRGAGVRVLPAKSTREALSLLEAHSDIDVIVTDLSRVEDDVPHEDAGRELLRAVRDRGRGMPMLIHASADAIARVRRENPDLDLASSHELVKTLARIGRAREERRAVERPGQRTGGPIELEREQPESRDVQ